MTVQASRDQLISEVQSAVRDTLAYFEGPGQRNAMRIDRWGAWDVLAHFPYWHYATTWGIYSSAAGGPPWQLSGTADEINAACLALHAGEGFEDLVGQLRRAQARLVRAARTVENLDTPAFARTDGQVITVRQRLETIVRHWRGYLDAYQVSG